MVQLLNKLLFVSKNKEFLRSTEWRRQHFLGIFILIMTCFIFFLFLVNLSKFLIAPSSDLLRIILMDILLIVLTLSALRLSNTRYSTFVAYLLLIAFNLFITFLLPTIYTSGYLFLYLLPTVAASFIIRERSSLLMALFSVVCYFIHLFITPAPEPINHLFLGAICVVALVAWFISSRLEYAIQVIIHSEATTQSLLDQNPLCVYQTEGGRTGQWTYVNSRIVDLLGYTPQEWLAQPNLWLQRMNPADQTAILANAATHTESGKAYSEEYSLKRKDGHVVWINDTYSISLQPGKPAAIQGVLLNITRRKYAEMAQEAVYKISQAAYTVDTPEQLYPLIHEALKNLMPVNNFYIALYDPERDMLFFPYFVDEVDRSPNPKPLGMGLTEYVLRHGKPLFARPEVFTQLVQDGEVQSIGAPSVDWLGVPLKVRERTIGVMAVQSYTEGVRFDNDDLEMLTFVSTQVAMVIERKRTEAALQYSENIYHSTIDSLDEFIHMVDADLRVVMANQSYRRFNHNMGIEGAIEARNLTELIPFKFDPAPIKDYQKILSSGERITMIDSREVGDQSMVTEVRLVPVTEHGKVERIITLTRDITRQKQAEEQIKSALREKEVLLREIHHRVKNNLQVMSSLLSLEMDYITDPKAQRLFMETQSRVRTMALIHEELYQSHNLAQIDFADYIHKLTNNLMQIYALQHNVDLKLNVDEVLLSVETAIPCGLIVNELMTNSLKYAFPGNRPGCISISLTAAHSGETPAQYELRVEDDGVGLPDDFNMNATTTLGLQLVTILCTQLKGKLTIYSDHGTHFVLSFSEQNSGHSNTAIKPGEVR